jgi:HSP20 family protein
MRELTTPFGRRSLLSGDGYRDPFSAFRREMDRLFDEFLTGPSGAAMERFEFSPALDLTENDKQVRLRAEIPGVDEKDVEISLEGDMLTIKGEKREERKEEGEHRRLYESAYGSFERDIRLPFEPRDQDVKAEFKNGVLTVTIQKPPEMAKTSKRIPIAKM